MDGKIDTVREALVDRVITFFNNRVTIGETEDECGDLVQVLELDKDFRADLAKMLSAIDPEAIRREYEEKITAAMVDIKTVAKAEMPSAKDVLARLIADTMSMARYYELEAAILSAEPAQDDGKEEAKE